jgi:hypothetical protein
MDFLNVLWMFDDIYDHNVLLKQNYVQLANKIIICLQNNKNTIIKLIKDYINLVEKWITSLLTCNPGDI